jgi:trehalose synthase
LLRSVGIDADWQVLRASDEFFGITKEVHNALQGADSKWSSRKQRIYLEHILDNATRLEGDWDFIVTHDPQPVALRSFVRDMPLGSSDAKWIWRCHIDLTDANKAVWEFFRPYVETHDASIWTLKEFAPDSLSMDRVVEAWPSIDPLSVKNLDLPMPFAEELCRQYGIDTRRPIVCQVSRYDPWKDPVGVIHAYRAVRERVTDAQLLLAGSMATDDPEGFRVWEQVQEERAGDPDIYTLSNLHQVGNVQINAFQRVADVVVQKSVREGFGLTVSEALWKNRPVVGGRAGGIVLQIPEGFDGFLVSSVEECAARIIDLIADPVGADAMGTQGREYVRAHFLATRELEDWLRLLTDLRE